MSMHTLSAAHFTVLYPEMVLSQFFISPVPDHEVCVYVSQFVRIPPQRLCGTPPRVFHRLCTALLFSEPSVFILPIRHSSVGRRRDRWKERNLRVLVTRIRGPGKRR